MPNFLTDLISCKGGMFFKLKFILPTVWYSYIEYVHRFDHPIVNEIDIQKLSLTFCFKTSW